MDANKFSEYFDEAPIFYGRLAFWPSYCHLLIWLQFPVVDSL
jgi:hypothetical protein